MTEEDKTKEQGEKPVEDENYEWVTVEDGGPSYSLFPTLIIIVAAAIGAGIGVALSGGRGSDDLISWLALPGDLFVRSLKLVVLPLVFVNIILAVVDMVRAGKASAVGWRTIGFYTLTTLVASIEGLIFVLIFKDNFTTDSEPEPAAVGAIVMNCQAGGAVTQNGTSVFCAETDPLAEFVMENRNNFVVERDQGGPADDISFSQTLQDGIFRKLISDNIVNEFVIANFVGIVVFAIVFGAASQSVARSPVVLIQLLEESNRIFLKVIDWIIAVTPIAVLSLIAGNIATRDDLQATFLAIGWLMASTIIAMACHFFLFLPLVFFLVVRQNPFKYIKFILPAQIFAFASASSAATLPITLSCVASTKQVPDSINNFVLSMGATLNMDGGGIYFPTAIVFLAMTTGLEDELNASAYFLIILLSTIGSAGTAPVPSASLVLILTAFNTVFESEGTPDTFGLILAVDWLMDRFRTTLNVTGDAMMARIITASTKSDIHGPAVGLGDIASDDGNVVKSTFQD